MVLPAAAVAPELKGIERLQGVATLWESTACKADFQLSPAVTQTASDVDDTAMVVHCLPDSDTMSAVCVCVCVCCKSFALLSQYQADRRPTAGALTVKEALTC